MERLRVSGKTYDRLKAVAQVYLPALGTLYFALAGIWGLPAAEQVIGTIVAIDTFLGVILQISSAKYNKDGKYGGVIHVVETDSGKKQVTLEVPGDPEEIVNSDEILFKVHTDKQPVES